MREMEKGKQLLDQGKNDEAFECFREIINNSSEAPSWQVYFYAGKALSGLNRNQVAIEYYDKAIELGPDGNEIIDPSIENAYINKGDSLVRIGNANEALEYYDIAIRIVYTKAFQSTYIPGKVPFDLSRAHNCKGVAFMKLSKNEEAVKCFDEAIKINNGEQAKINKTRALYNLEKYEEVLEQNDVRAGNHNIQLYKARASVKLDKSHTEIMNYFERAVKDVHKNNSRDQNFSNKAIAEINFHKGLYLLKYKEDYKSAENCFDSVINNSSENLAYTYLHKGEALRGQEKFEEASQCFEESIKLNPSIPEAYYYKAKYLASIGEYKKAIESLDKVIENNPSTDNFRSITFMDKGDMLEKLSYHKNAIECYDKALSFQPEASRIYYSKAVSFKNLAKYKKAIECYDKLFELEGEKADIYTYKGLALNNLGQYKQAINCFDKSFVLDKVGELKLENYLGKGNALYNLGMYSRAFSHYNRSLKLEPESLGANICLAKFMEHSGNYEQAKEYYETALDKDLYNVDLNLYLANIYFKTEQYREALSFTEKANEIAGNYSHSKLIKGIILSQIGKLEAAIDCFLEAKHILAAESAKEGRKTSLEDKIYINRSLEPVKKQVAFKLIELAKKIKQQNCKLTSEEIFEYNRITELYRSTIFDELKGAAGEQKTQLESLAARISGLNEKLEARDEINHNIAKEKEIGELQDILEKANFQNTDDLLNNNSKAAKYCKIFNSIFEKCFSDCFLNRGNAISELSNYGRDNREIIFGKGEKPAFLRKYIQPLLDSISIPAVKEILKLYLGNGALLFNSPSDKEKNILALSHSENGMKELAQIVSFELACHYYVKSVKNIKKPVQVDNSQASKEISYIEEIIKNYQTELSDYVLSENENSGGDYLVVYEAIADAGKLLSLCITGELPVFSTNIFNLSNTENVRSIAWHVGNLMPQNTSKITNLGEFDMYKSYTVQNNEQVNHGINPPDFKARKIMNQEQENEEIKVQNSSTSYSGNEVSQSVSANEVNLSMTSSLIETTDSSTTTQNLILTGASADITSEFGE